MRDLGQVWRIRFGTPISEVRRQLNGVPEEVLRQGRHTYYRFGSVDEPINATVRTITVAASGADGAYKISVFLSPGDEIRRQALDQLIVEYGPPDDERHGGGVLA